MSYKRNFIVIFLILIFNSSLNGQMKMLKQGYIPFIVNGFELESPFIGGLNSPQFQMLDFNQDGLKDLLIFDRNDDKILTFLRTSKNTYKYAPEYQYQLPVGNFIYRLADLNSDSLLDVFTLANTGELLIYLNSTKKGDKKLSFKSLGPQYYRNQNPDGSFILYNPLSFAGTKTDLPTIQDIDNDGDVDIVTYDQLNQTYYMFKDVRAEKGWSKDTFEFQNMDYCFGYFWETYDNKIKLNFCNYKQKLKPRHNGGAACWMFDDDNDGDQEMVLSNVGYKKMTILKNGKKDFANYYDTMISADSTFPSGTESFKSFIFPAGYMLELDGDSLTDMLLAPNGIADVKETQNVYFYKNIGTKRKSKFELQKTNFIAEKMVDLGARSAPAFMDIDNDGDQDLLVAHNGDFEISKGNHDIVTLFKNIGTKKTPKYQLDTYDYLKTKDSSYKHFIPTIGDIDNDGDLDLIMGGMRYEDTFYGIYSSRILWYENTAGKNNAPKFSYKTNQLVNHSFSVTEFDFAPEVFDYNKDGINDLLIGKSDGNISAFQGKGGTFPQFDFITKTAWGAKGNKWRTDLEPNAFENFGYSVPRFVDLNKDGINELAVGTFYGGIRLYHIDGHSLADSLSADDDFVREGFLNGDTFTVNFGHRVIPTFADIDGDSIPEMLAGNYRGGLDFAINPNAADFRGNSNTVQIESCVVYPNPASSYFTIEKPNSWSKCEVTVYSVEGKLIFSSTINSQEKLSSYKCPSTPGLYMIQLRSSTGTKAIGKLIVSHN